MRLGDISVSFHWRRSAKGILVDGRTGHLSAVFDIDGKLLVSNDAIPTPTLCRIKETIGSLDGGGDRLPVLCQRHPKARGELICLTGVQPAFHHEPSPHPVGDRHGIIRQNAGKQNCKFLAAKADDAALRPGLGLEQGPEARDNDIAEGMAETVVYGFKMVDVGQNDGG